MPKRRNFDALSEAQLATGRMEMRRVTGLASFRFCGVRPLVELLDTIQHVAEAATGERSFLHWPETAERRPGTRPPSI